MNPQTQTINLAGMSVAELTNLLIATQAKITATQATIAVTEAEARVAVDRINKNIASLNKNIEVIQAQITNLSTPVEETPVTE